MTKYIEFDENGKEKDRYQINDRTLTKSNKLTFASKKSKILFDEDCELNCLSVGTTNRISVIKKGSYSLTPAKIKSRLDLNEETGAFSFTIKRDILDEWKNR